jgi:nascent polypeptide-associated complex subunit alpha
MLPKGMNPRQMNQMMKKLGINVKDIPNVEKVIILTDKKEYVFSKAEVTVMDAQGQKTYQVVGNPVVANREKKLPKEDIALVVEQTGVSEEDAIKTLKKTDGDIAEAIMKLSSE